MFSPSPTTPRIRQILLTILLATTAAAAHAWAQLGDSEVDLQIPGVGTSAPSPRTPPPPRAPVTLPAAWHGVWRGPMRVNTLGAAALEGTMELHVAPTARPGEATWTVVYEAPGSPRQQRPYVIQDVDGARGQFQVDERNGIILPATLLDGALYMPFRYGEVIHAASYRLEGEAIQVEIQTFDLRLVKPTGGPGQQVPVAGFVAKSVQRAALRRVPAAVDKAAK